MSSFASADIISIIGQGMPVRMDPTKAGKPDNGFSGQSLCNIKSVPIHRGQEWPPYLILC